MQNLSEFQKRNQGGQSYVFNVSQICEVPRGMRKEEHCDRMPQFSLGLQWMPVDDDYADYDEYTFKCVPLEKHDLSGDLEPWFLGQMQKIGRYNVGGDGADYAHTLYTIDDWAGNENPDEFTTRMDLTLSKNEHIMQCPIRSTGTCVTTTAPRALRGFEGMVHNVAWGFGGMQLIRNIWQETGVSNGDYVGYVIDAYFSSPVIGEGEAGNFEFHKMDRWACCFEQGGTLCNRGLSSVEPASWYDVVQRVRVLRRKQKKMTDGSDFGEHDEDAIRLALGVPGGEDINIYRISYIVSVGMILGSTRLSDVRDPHMVPMKVGKEFLDKTPASPVDVFMDVQEAFTVERIESDHIALMFGNDPAMYSNDFGELPDLNANYAY